TVRSKEQVALWNATFLQRRHTGVSQDEFWPTVRREIRFDWRDHDGLPGRGWAVMLDAPQTCGATFATAGRLASIAAAPPASSGERYVALYRTPSFEKTIIEGSPPQLENSRNQPIRVGSLGVRQIAIYMRDLVAANASFQAPVSAKLHRPCEAHPN